MSIWIAKVYEKLALFLFSLGQKGEGNKICFHVHII